MLQPRHPTTAKPYAIQLYDPDADMAFAKIDVHSHFLPPVLREALAAEGHLPGPDGINIIPEWFPESHLAFMDAHNISRAYLSISSPGTVLNPHSPPTLTLACNDYGAALKRAHPTRFGHFASLPLPDIPASLAEITRCTTDLSADGFALLTNHFGIYPGDALLAPIWSALDAVSAVVFIHPTAPCTPAAAAAHPTSPPARRAAVQPLADCYATTMLDFMFETTRAWSDILLSGIAARHPRIRWIVPHAGAALPSTLDRVIGFAGVMGPKPGSPRGGMEALTARGVRELFERSFYFDLAGLGIGNTLPALLRWVSHRRIMYGSDVPYTPWRASGALEEELRAVLMDMWGGETGAEECRCVCRGNAELLFGP